MWQRMNYFSNLKWLAKKAKGNYKVIKCYKTKLCHIIDPVSCQFKQNKHEGKSPRMIPITSVCIYIQKNDKLYLKNQSQDHQQCMCTRDV